MADTAVSPIVAADLSCVGCGYNLRGLAEEGECPECGVAIERSLAGERLSAADPAWLRKIVRGRRLLSSGLVIAVFTFVLFFVIAIGGGVLSGAAPGWIEPITFVLGACDLLVVLGATVGATVGAFLVTALEPRETLQTTQRSPRAISRWAMVSICVLAAARMSMTEFAAPVAVLRGLELALVGALTAAIAALLIHLAALARRAGDRRLADRTRKFANNGAWLLPVTVVCVMLFPTLSGVSIAALPFPLRALALTLGCFATVFPFVLLWQFGKFVQLLSDHRKGLVSALHESSARRPIQA